MARIRSDPATEAGRKLDHANRRQAPTLEKLLALMALASIQQKWVSVPGAWCFVLGWCLVLRLSCGLTPTRLASVHSE
jgi:hypothetical protein